MSLRLGAVFFFLPPLKSKEEFELKNWEGKIYCNSLDAHAKLFSIFFCVYKPVIY